MIDVIFDDLQNEIQKRLMYAQKSVHIAVAWVNFKVYDKIFRDLLHRGVKVEIVVNDDFINKRYDSIINRLILEGAAVKKFRMASTRQYMHEKFVVIDSQWVLFGSYNWSQNANKNFEYLAFCDEQNIIAKFQYEFRCLWDLSREDIIALQQPRCCDLCRMPMYNIGVISPEGYYQTRFEVYQQCGCDFRIKEKYTEFYDIAVYNNFQGIIDKFNCVKEELFMFGIDFDEKEEERALQGLDIQVANYLAGIRHSTGNINIHAVGIYSYRDCKYDDGRRFIKLVWKEKFVMVNLEDEYELS